MIRLIQRRLIIPRGDTGTFTVPLLATAQTGDVSVFTIFDQKTQKKVFEKIVTIEGEALQIEFSHADTVNLPVGDYVWDIKFYKDPIIVDDKLINGTEIDSYYAAFKLPVCEIRQTGDALLTADDAPTTTIEPNSLNVLTAAMEVTSQNKASVEQAAATVAEDLEEVEGLAAQVRENAEAAGNAATSASTSASAAGEALADTISAKNDAVAANTAAQQALVGANAAATNATTKATEASASAVAASNSASAASSSASEAATSASNAAASVTEMEALVRAIPTNVSEFENDAGYITAAALPTKVSDLTDDSGHYTKPAGGIPASDLAETYLTEHQDISGKADKSEIPTKVSQLQNDSGYLTSFTETDPTVPTWAKAAQKPSYTAAEVGAPTIQEMNTAISTAISNVNSFDMAVVQELPTQDISTHTIYLVPKIGETNDVYDEYVYINNAWEIVGNTQVDLSDYALKSELPEVPVQDVQVNGTSILENGVANVPVANDTLGLVRVASTGQDGVRIRTEDGTRDKLMIVGATETEIKNRNNFKPVLPSHQHESTFYGLAKAAGDTTQSQSNNAVGTYTDEAKTAIQTMLDVPAKDDIPEVSVQDVQVNGVSVLQDGVANVPRANNTVFGVVRTGNAFAFSNDTLILSMATESDIKGGTNNIKATGPNRQHLSVFYGLAKAAGHDEKDSAEPFGTYTPEAKAAIQSMLGVSDLIATAENNLVASKAYAIGEVFTANGKLYKATAAIAADAAIIPAVEGEEIAGANCEETSIGEGFPHDVQVNGVSVISEGVANIPEAVNNGSYGVVKISSGNGIGRAANGYLYVVTSTDAQVKSGTNSARPISPLNQHLSTFYGLAKAAGDTTQVASDNAVGTYTDEAKAAIKNMLGITHTLTVTVLTQDNVTVTGQTVTVRADNASGEIYATAAYEGQPVSFSVPDGFQYYVSVSDTLDHHFNPTTASGIVSNTDIAVTLQYSDFSTIRTAADIKAALNAGMDLTDLVGEQITCSKGDDTLTWDVVDYDATNGHIMLLLHDAFGTANMLFEPAQALMWCENGLAAGSYTFTWQNTQCYFTLTTAIPAGGQLRATNSQFQTYASQDAIATLETGTVGTEEIAGATDLGHEGQGLLNHRDRVNYGSNNYAESALLWWLNSDAAANTLRTPVTKFSRAYSYAQPGFMNGLDANFVNCLDEVDWLCSTNNVYECPESLGGYTKGIKQAYTITKKIGLASEMEIFGSYGGNSDGSTVFDLYNGAEATDRIKYRGTSAQTWWLRSPTWSLAGYERTVYSSGGAGDHSAGGSYAVVPACRISRTAE